MKAPDNLHPARNIPTDVRRMLRRVVAAREEERARIARDLHDHVGQQLTALRLMLERHRAECGSRSRRHVNRALLLAQEIDSELDSLAWDLRPGIAADLGLASSLRQLAARCMECAPMKVECRCEIPHGRLVREVETAAYRIAQEALNNALKHSRATHLIVIGEIAGNALLLVVQDDGAGFDVSKNLASARGMGLRGMRERAALLKGRIEIASAPKRGTTVSLRIPGAVK